MTFEQTRQAIYGMFFDNIHKDNESLKLCCEVDNHLEALQADYDRLLVLNKVLEKKVEALNSRVNKPYEDMKVRYARLLEKNKMLKVENKMLKVENEKLNDMLDEHERSWL